MIKKINELGQKDYQRNDSEDRALCYRKWLRTVDTDGYYLDVDFIKFRDGVPCAITELTRTDSAEEPETAYLDAIIQRYFGRDRQGEHIERVAMMLEVPAYLVLFNKECYWFWVFSFNRREWKYFTRATYIEFLSKL